MTILNRTIVEIDLVGYSIISLNVEDSLDVSSVSHLNRQIQAFIDSGLSTVNASRDKNVVAETGDGAILMFASALYAHCFAEAVHEATRQHNQTKKHYLSKRIFRVGMASGDIVVNPKLRGGVDIAGTTIVRAVRLEAKAQPGGCLVDEVTYSNLPIEKQTKYSGKIYVAGKRNEEFEAYACH